MTSDNHAVTTTLRIPGAWSHPGELMERLPEGYRLSPETLTLPDGTEIEFIPMPPDDQFAEIFRTSYRRPPSEAELTSVDRYRVNIGLNGPGGSIEAASTMMQAGAAIVRAGGAGVFIDNCGLSHGGSHWIEMADDRSPDALSFAFVTIVGGEQDLWTMGMHVMGFPEFLLSCTDPETDPDTLVEVIRYVCQDEKPIAAGHLLLDEHGPRFQAVEAPGDEWMPDSPVHNPFGRLRLVRMKDIAEGN